MKLADIQETWSPTMILAFAKDYEKQRDNLADKDKVLLWQQWTSTAGRTCWKQVVETNSQFIYETNLAKT